MVQSVYYVHGRSLRYKGKKTYPQNFLTLKLFTLCNQWSIQELKKTCTEKHSGFLSIKQGRPSLVKEMIGALVTILTFAYCFISNKARTLHRFIFLIVLGKGHVYKYGSHVTGGEMRAQGNEVFCPTSLLQRRPTFCDDGKALLFTLSNTAATSHRGYELLRYG